MENTYLSRDLTLLDILTDAFVLTDSINWSLDWVSRQRTVLRLDEGFCPNIKLGQNSAEKNTSDIIFIPLEYQYTKLKFIYLISIVCFIYDIYLYNLFGWISNKVLTEY